MKEYKNKNNEMLQCGNVKVWKCKSDCLKLWKCKKKLQSKKWKYKNMKVWKFQTKWNFVNGELWKVKEYKYENMEKL